MHNCWYARCIRAVSWETADTAPFNVFTILMISQSVVACSVAGDGGAPRYSGFWPEIKFHGRPLLPGLYHVRTDPLDPSGGTSEMSPSAGPPGPVSSF